MRTVIADLRVFLLSLFLVPAVSACVANPSRSPQAMRDLLAPTGSLRVALYTGTPTSLVATGDSRGVGHDLGRDLAQRLGVPFEPVIFAKNADVLEAIKSGRTDVAFTNASPERAREMDFTAPYLVIELGYLARPGAAVAALADVDRPGVRVGVTAGSSSDAALSRDLKAANVVRFQTVGEGTQALAAAQIDVYATNKATLYGMLDKLPGGHLLDGSWGFERHALAIPHGRTRGQSYVGEFVVDEIRSGRVQAAVTRAGLRGAVVALLQAP